MRLLALKVALCVMCAIGFADMYSYSMPVAFLGQILAQNEASSVTVMLALGLDGIATCIMAVLVLLCQSLPAAGSMSVAAKWWLVIAGQAGSVASSLLPALLPQPQVVTACRAMHGAATAVYMVYCLILLAELCPQKHLALGIAALSAACSAGDSLGPVFGAVAFDRGGGLQAAFLLQTAVNAVPLLLALLVIPLWVQNNSNTPTITSAAATASTCGRGSSSSSSSDSEGIDSSEISYDVQRRLSCDSASSCDLMTLPAETSLVAKFAKLVPAAAAHDATVTAHDTEAGVQLASVHGMPSAGTSARRRPTSLEVSRYQTAAYRAAAAPAPAAAASPSNLASDSDVFVLKDSSGLRHMDSAFDLEPGRHAVAHQVKWADSDLSMAHDLSDHSRQQQQTLDRDRSSTLDLRSVLSTVGDAVVASQCGLVLLEQAVTGAVVVLLPAVMDLPTWLVGVLYIAMVAGAVSGPFALEAYLSCKLITNKRTYHVACVISITFGISSFLVVPLSRCLPALACLLFIFGVSQATTETLVYIHVAKRLKQLGKHVATHVSMCMFTIALALGAGLGNMVGGALQQQNSAVQLGVTSAMAGVTGLYGCVLSLTMAKVASRQVECLCLGFRVMFRV